jgi:hypothetical protein
MIEFGKSDESQPFSRPIEHGATGSEVTRKAVDGDQCLSELALFETANARMKQGLTPPPEIYRIEYRNKFDWTQQPGWAQPTDPQMFDGCCHEG